ncbi:serine/threonine-protein kinase SIK2-like isoform X2 [Zea mays]|uniref:serine/threonine-protein kinase SIK2-like isoform X2 n=1 Tax=Zea mays TaxID=4577 RepID=UPI001651CEE4|nr:serine/threonine-protein kinase SIK2-like isoform X2 [Zea mays]
MGVTPHLLPPHGCSSSTPPSRQQQPPVHGCQPLLPFCPTAQQLCAPPPMDAQKFQQQGLHSSSSLTLCSQPWRPKKNPLAEPPLPASAPVPLLLLPRTAAARPTFPRCAAPRRNAAVPASPGFLAATAARMPSARHNVKGDVLLQHVVTLPGCSLFLAQTRSRHRRPSDREVTTVQVMWCQPQDAVGGRPKEGWT